MPFTYAIADLHGRYDLLIEALDKIIWHAGGDNPGTIITLGDYVDRGFQGRQIVEYLMRGLRQDGQWRGWKLVSLKGNHEEIMHQCCKSGRLGWWLDNGGSSTLFSYGVKWGDKADVSVVPRSHLKWMSELPMMHVDKHRVYVHAGVLRNRPLEGQERFSDRNGNPTITWMLYHANDEGGHGYYHVVHGHHFHEDGPLLKKGRTNLDTCAYHNGRLVIGVFDDDIPCGPIELLEVNGFTLQQIIDSGLDNAA